MRVVFGLCLTFLVFPLTTLNAQSKLKIDTKQVVLGTIYDGKRQTASFNLTNIGRDTLKLLKLTSSCGCTMLEEKPEYILPGKKWKMNVAFNSTGQHGAIQKHIELLTNEPTASAHRLIIKANVISEFELANQQKIVNLGEFVLGGRAKRSTEMTNVSNEAIFIMKTRSDNERIKALAEHKIVAPGQRIELTFDLSLSEVGTFTEVVYLVTSSMNQQYVPVKVTYTVTLRD